MIHLCLLLSHQFHMMIYVGPATSRYVDELIHNKKLFYIFHNLKDREHHKHYIAELEIELLPEINFSVFNFDRFDGFNYRLHLPMVSLHLLALYHRTHLRALVDFSKPEYF